MGREPQFGYKDESLADGEVRKKAVVLADVSDTLLHQLGCVGLPVDHNLARCHYTAFIPTRYYVQQRCFTTA